LSLKSTQKCNSYIEFQEEDFEETVLTTVDEILALGKAGWAKYDDAAFNGFMMNFYQGTCAFRKLQKNE
jgi:hypothetical protein